MKIQSDLQLGWIAKTRGILRKLESSSRDRILVDLNPVGAGVIVDAFFIIASVSFRSKMLLFR